MAILAGRATLQISQSGRGRTCSSLPSTPDTRSSTAVQRIMTQPVGMRAATTRFTWWRDSYSEPAQGNQVQITKENRAMKYKALVATLVVVGLSMAAWAGD